MKTNEGVLVLFVRKSPDNPNTSSEVLLAKRSLTAKIGKGKLNGYGGKIKKNETPKHATVREVDEETKHGLIVREQDLEPRGKIIFYNFKGLPICDVHLFVCLEFSGEPNESKEMLDPKWYAASQIASLDMMPGDRLFIPILLEGRTIPDGWITFSEDFSKVISRSLESY